METDPLLLTQRSNQALVTTKTNTMYSESRPLHQPITTEPTSLRSGSYAQNSSTINILLVGRSQVGKSTLVESLKDPTYSSSRTGISQTREPSYKQLTLTSDDDGKQYILNIIDTPGLREIRHSPNETRTDEQLLDLMRGLFEDGRIRALNIIAFVSVMGKTYQNDIDTFHSLIDFFGPQFSSISALILTHCDKISNERANELTEELRRHPKCAEVVNYCELGVYHHGTLDIDDLDTYTPDLRNHIRDSVLKHLKPMRIDLTRFILSRWGRQKELNENDFKKFQRNVASIKEETTGGPCSCCLYCCHGAQR